MSSNTEDSGEPKQSRAGVGTTLLSIWSWFVFGACVALWMPMMAIVWLVTLPFDRARWWTGYLYRKLPVVHQKLNPLWHFKVSGVLPDNPRNPYVVVSNHESFVDILLISHLPWEMKWLSKKEMFRSPSQAGLCGCRRTSRSNGATARAQVRRWISARWPSTARCR
ncbi:MAG: hypothetical protein R2789_04080 [Microthrixaceae bacterium]